MTNGKTFIFVDWYYLLVGILGKYTTVSIKVTQEIKEK
jgi:hypothetical protein